MNINLVPIYSFLHKKNEQIIKDDALFVDEINNYLLEEDLLIVEKAKEPLFDVYLIGSGGTENLFLKKMKVIEEPIVILSTSQKAICCKRNEHSQNI